MQYLILGLYLAMFVVIGIIASRKTKTTSDFFLGGRRFGPWITAFSYGTTYFSAVIFVGYAGNFGWDFGVSAMWIGIANAVLGCLVPWLLLARPTNRITKQLDAKTMPDFFEKRYSSRNLKIVSAIIIFVFLVPYCASVYQGLSYFFEAVLNIPYQYCMIGMALLTGLYLVLGGYMATAIVDFIQGTLMIAVTVMMVLFVVNSPVVGGLNQGLERLSAIDPNLATVFGSSGTLLPLISLVLLTSVGTWALPQMVHKFYTIRDEKAIKTGTVISTVFALIIGFGAYFTGAFGRLFVDSPIKPAAADTIMPTMLTGALPESLLGILVVLVLAASMSTLSSLVLVSSSAIAMDLFKGVLRPKMEDRRVMMMMRVLCAVFVLFSLAVALGQIEAIYALMSFSWGAISGAFIGPFVLGVRWKGVTRAAAWAAVIAGVGLTVGLTVLNIPGLTAPMIGVIAMAFSFVLTFSVSLFTKKYSKEHTDAVAAALLGDVGNLAEKESIAQQN